MTNFISQTEAEELCEAMLRLHLGRDAPTPDRIDIDSFVRDYLKCQILYETFAEDDPDKIGFAGDGRTSLRIKRAGKPMSAVFPFKTIVLDRRLLILEESTHRRFTLAHEAGHIIAMRLNPDSAACFHHAHDLEREYTLKELQERYTISEWQANTIAASLLMPQSPKEVQWRQTPAGLRGNCLPSKGKGYPEEDGGIPWRVFYRPGHPAARAWDAQPPQHLRIH